MGKSAFTAQQKYEVIVSYEDRKTSISDFCRQYNVSDETIKEWIYQFQTYGMDGLNNPDGWKRYSKDVKNGSGP